MEKGFKQTEIGLIPSDWKLVSFGEVFTFLNTASYSRSELTNNSEVKYVHYGDIHTKLNHFIDFNKAELPSIKTEKVKNYNFIQEGDLIMADASEDYSGIGKSVEVINLGKQKAISGLHTYLMRDKLSHFINGFRAYIHTNPIVKKQFDQLATGMKVYGVSKNNLKKIYIPYSPTKAEQSAIASALSDIDNLISSLEKLIAKKQSIKQGAMQKLLQPKEGWSVKNLAEIAEIIMGQSPLSEYYNTERKGLPLIQGNADVENRKTIIRFYTSSITKRGKVGDIIMSVRAPVGEIARATFDCCLGRGVCAIRFKNDFLYHYLIYFEKSWAKFSTGSTFDSVNSTQVKELEIPIPLSEMEQQHIATTLTDIDLEIEKLQQQLAKYKLIKQGMMQNLLTGKKRLV